MAIWDAELPGQSSFVQSSVIREALLALQEQALGVNLLGDPEFKIWAAGDTVIPSWWQLSGTPTIARETTTLRGGAFGLKLTYVSGTPYAYQSIIDSTTWATKIEDALIGERFSSGVAIYTTSSGCTTEFYGGGSGTFGNSSSAITTGSWQWDRLTSGLIDSSTSEVSWRVNITSAGYVIICTPVLVMGPIAPSFYIPAPMKRGTLACQKIGDPVTTGEFFRYRHNLPFIVERVDIDCSSAATGQALIADVEHDGTSMFSTRPQIAIAGTAGGAAPDGTYRYQCFDAGFGTVTTDALMQVHIDQAPTSGGQDPTVSIRVLTYDPPFLAWRAGNSYK